MRPYRGVEAATRLAQRREQLLAAGLDLLGGRSAAEADVTVRAVCKQSGLAARYFYESFADKDEFISAVFDWVITDLATSTQAVVDAAPLREQTGAAMTHIVRTIANDPRVGRLLFNTEVSNDVLVRKRVGSTALFAMLLSRHAGNALQLEPGDHLTATAHFAVGGVGQTISAWLAGELSFSPDELAAHLRTLLNDLAGL